MKSLAEGIAMALIGGMVGFGAGVYLLGKEEHRDVGIFVLGASLLFAIVWVLIHQLRIHERAVAPR